jgi:hypothetical protein
LKKKIISYQDASLAASFFEPTYQRFRLWNHGQLVNLLCFVRPSNAAVRQLLEEHSAKESPFLRAKCFAEVWELPSQGLSEIPSIELCELDKRISEKMGCLERKYSAAAGTLWWGDINEGPARRRFTSRLLQESQTKQQPSR